MASQQGTLTLPDTWFRPPFWDLLMLQLLRPNSSNLPCLYSTFHLEYPLVLSRFYLQLTLQRNLSGSHMTNSKYFHWVKLVRDKIIYKYTGRIIIQRICQMFIRRRGRNTMTLCLGGGDVIIHSLLNYDQVGRNSIGFNPNAS